MAAPPLPCLLLLGVPPSPGLSLLSCSSRTGCQYSGLAASPGQFTWCPGGLPTPVLSDCVLVCTSVGSRSTHDSHWGSEVPSRLPPVPASPGASAPPCLLGLPPPGPAPQLRCSLACLASSSGFMKLFGERMWLAAGSVHRQGLCCRHVTVSQGGY